MPVRKLRSRRATGWATAAALIVAPSVVAAYPGGTPDFQTDVAPFCAACHSSTSVESLDGAGPRAEKEVAAQKHIAPLLAGEGSYKDLSEADRKMLAQQIEALDANSTVEILDFPPQVAAGATFNVTVKVTGGAGPVVGVGLVDRAHRWYARPASAVWEVVGAPTIIGPDDRPQSEWIDHRPERFGRKITFVNIEGIESDAVAGKWSKAARVIYTLRAPTRPGDYPLAAAYLYGTEKATKLGSTVHPIYKSKLPLGGYGGKSGRVKFAAPAVISVK